MSASIAIVGRPNVGKSTIFNRLIGERLAVISKISGTTRDRIHKNVNYHDYEVIFVDTGGISTEKKDSLEQDVITQAKVAIQDADIIYFIIDVQEGLTIDDHETVKVLRKSKKDNVILIANKVDHPKYKAELAEYYKLGFGEPIGLSAIHNVGFDLLEEYTLNLLQKLGIEKTKPKKKNSNEIKISVLGKPNVGKSSLVNALSGSKRAIVSDIPGTTRDATDTKIEYEGDDFVLIDTAGLKRRGKILPGLDKFSLFRCLTALDKSDVALLLLDASEKISKQDLHIAQYILEAGRGLILIINKIDLLESEYEKEKFLKNVEKKFVFVPWAPVIFISALKKKNINKIYELSKEIVEERKKMINTKQLNAFIREIFHKHYPGSTARVKTKVLYIKQIEINPPTFLMFINVKALHFSYKRYLKNEFRKKFGFGGTPIKFVFKFDNERNQRK
jgi:GTP-binding protein